MQGRNNFILPWTAIPEDGQIRVRWVPPDGLPFTEPFFQETVQRLRNQAIQNKLPDTAPGELLTRSSGLYPVPLKALMFHVSRCGSTLITQMLARDPQNIVLSEPPLFDDLLRLRFHQISAEDSRLWLQAAMRICFQPAWAEATRAVLKTDCWHLHYFDELRTLQPDARIFFVYRHPAEVMRSHKRRRGMQAVPGLIQPEHFGMTEGSFNYADDETWKQAVFENLYQRMLHLAQQHPGIELINYSEGPERILQRVISAADLTVSEQTHSHMVQRSKYYSKTGTNVFQGDEPEPLPAVRETTMAAYAALEKLRLSRAAQS